MLSNYQLDLNLRVPPAARIPVQDGRTFRDHLLQFCEFGKSTIQEELHARDFEGNSVRLPAYINEFWTAKQRAAHSLHEISYRACFKPQLPRFFIERLTAPGETVYDPFMGRGTTLVEAALLGRVPCGTDVNPLSKLLVAPRLNPPALDELAGRLSKLNLEGESDIPEDLLVFYHPETLREICALRGYLQDRRENKTFDNLDAWIEMVAINRLTGHSNGFFSVYTLPPNQAVSVKSQLKINEKRKQIPPRRDIKAIILKKSRALLKDLTPEQRAELSCAGVDARLVTSLASDTPEIPGESVALVVTSPPFLDIVQYATDNWLRCWFAGIDVKTVQITAHANVAKWQEVMTAVFKELRRVLRPGGHVAFEVGEVRNGSVKLEEAVIPCGIAAGLRPELVLINSQVFTKTANCWGVDNNAKGTNSNRIVLFQK